MEDQKSNKTTLIIAIVAGVVILVGAILLIVKLFNPKQQTPVFSLKNTSWVDSDSSEMVFTEDRLNWYQSEADYTDNYYTGSYALYVGEDAVEYITTTLSSYGVTKDELESVFENNENYSVSNFIVIDVIYDSTVIGGVTSVPTNPHTPYFGFVLEDGTFLDIANMNTGSYLSFAKK